MLPFGALIAGYGLKWLWSLDVIRYARPLATAAGARRVDPGRGVWRLDPGD